MNCTSEHFPFLCLFVVLHGQLMALCKELSYMHCSSHKMIISYEHRQESYKNIIACHYQDTVNGLERN